MAGVEVGVWLDEDGILRIRYPQDFNLTLDVMEKVHQRRLGTIGEPCPVLVYAETVASAEYEAQQFASREDVAALVSGMAVIVKSVFTRAMAELFMRFHKPPYPSRLFRDEVRALSWLKQYLPDKIATSGTDNNPVWFMKSGPSHAASS